MIPGPPSRGNPFNWSRRISPPISRRRQLLREAGLDIPALIGQLNRGETVTFGLPTEAAPLPLPAGLWTPLVEPTGEMAGCLFTALLGDRRLSLLYYGLSSVDPQTRRQLAPAAAPFRQLASGSRPGVLATRGRSLRVRDGRVDVPGGEPAIPLWEGVVGASVRDPMTFVLTLLDRDAGRLALLFDTIAHLDAPRQRFALGLSRTDPADRLARLRALYLAFQGSTPDWDAGARPFFRAADDGARLLMVTRLTSGGELVAPGGRKFWQNVFAGSDVPVDQSGVWRLPDRDQALDAASLVDLISVTNTAVRMRRTETWQFAQRAFPARPAADLPDIFICLRGFSRFRMLLLTLERMGIQDPSIYASAIRQAHRLSLIGDRDDLAASLGQFQGVLAAIERVRFSRAITAETAGELIRSLSAVPVTSRYQGMLAAWIELRLLPVLPQTSCESAGAALDLGPIESRVLGAIAGCPAVGEEAGTIDWEGQQYRVAPGPSEFNRLGSMRRKQRGTSLDAALGFYRVAISLPEAVKASRQVPDALKAIRAAFEDAVRDPGPGAARTSETGALTRMFNAALGQLDARRPSWNPRDRILVAGMLLRVSDRLLASSLESLAYAPHLGDPNGLALLAGDPSARHDLGVDEPTMERRAEVAWSLPEEKTGSAGGWHVSGSLLGLDMGLARLALRRVASDSLPNPPTVSDNERRAITESAVLLSATDMTDAGQTALAGALGRGRARVRALKPDQPGLDDVIRVAGAGEWTREVLPWVLDHDPDRVLEYLSLVELLRIGELESAPLPSLDAWGTSQYVIDGCLCVRFPAAEPWENDAGMKGKVLVVSQVADLVLRVAETLAGLGLPARLARPVMLYATQDLLDGLRPSYGDDWTTMVAVVRRIPRARIEDYVAALTTGGPLVPVERDARE